MEPLLGQIQAFGFSFAPRGWMTCQGQLVAITTNSALFSLLGTTFGGDGQTTFGLPDFRGRTMIGQGQGPGLGNYIPGQIGGAESVLLTINNMPEHTHIATSPAHTHTATATSTLYAEGLPGDKANPLGNLMAGSANMYKSPDQPTQNLALNAESITSTVVNDSTTVTVTNSIAGSSLPFDPRAPYLCVNVCIATEGVFPSRN